MIYVPWWVELLIFLAAVLLLNGALLLLATWATEAVVECVAPEPTE